MKILFMFFLCIITITVNAQKQFYPGVKAGGSIVNWIISNASPKSRASYYAGIYGSFKLTPRFIVQPEVLYTNLGPKGEISGEKYKLDYLSLPVVFKYQTMGGFYGETGPQISYLLSAKYDGVNGEQDIKDLLKPQDFGWVFGLGYKFKPGIEIGVRKFVGLSQVNPDAIGKLRNDALFLGVAYTFGK